MTTPTPCGPTPSSHGRASSPEHSPTLHPLPWKITGKFPNFWIKDANNKYIFHRFGDRGLAEYAVACVNACREIPSAALEGKRLNGPYRSYLPADPYEAARVYLLQENPDHAE